MTGALLIDICVFYAWKLR